MSTNQQSNRQDDGLGAELSEDQDQVVHDLDQVKVDRDALGVDVDEALVSH